MMNLTKKELKELPNSPAGNETKRNIAEYVSLVMSGKPKTEALKQALPDRYQRAEERAAENDNGKGKGSVLNANLQKEINQVERSQYAKDLYASEHKDWWIKFLGKKQKAFETLFEIGLDKRENARNRVDAIRTLLQHMPDKQQDIKVDVQVNAGQDFKEMLKQKQNELYKIANGEVIDVEPIE